MCIRDRAFRELEQERTLATWRYTFTVKPAALSAIGDPIGEWMLGRDIEQRLAGFATGCSNPDIVAKARAQLGT